MAVYTWYQEDIWPCTTLSTGGHMALYYPVYRRPYGPIQVPGGLIWPYTGTRRPHMALYGPIWPYIVLQGGHMALSRTASRASRQP